MVVLVGVAVGVVKLFIRWEREGKEHLVPLVLLGMLVIEATIYADQNTLPRRIFHPGSGSTQLRLPEIYITLALLARLIARGKPTRIGLPAGLWLAFAAWMAVGAVEGHLYHNALSQDLYEAKDILYIVGAYALAAGVPVRRYFDSGDLFKLGYLDCCVRVDRRPDDDRARQLQHQSAAAPVAGFRGGRLGDGRPHPRHRDHVLRARARRPGPIRLRHVLALVPLLVSVVLANQRAVLVNLAVAGVGAARRPPVGHRHGVARQLHVRAGQLVLALLAIVALAWPSSSCRPPSTSSRCTFPLASTFQSLFHSEGKAESAQDRLNLAAEAEN